MGYFMGYDRSLHGPVVLTGHISLSAFKSCIQKNKIFKMFFIIFSYIIFIQIILCCFKIIVTLLMTETSMTDVFP